MRKLALLLAIPLVIVIGVLVFVVLSLYNATSDERADEVERGMIRELPASTPRKRFRAAVKPVEATCKPWATGGPDFWECRVRYRNKFGQRYAETMTVCGGDWAGNLALGCETHRGAERVG